MTPQEIKENAPEGATHYDFGCNEYIKNDNDTWYCWDKGTWETTRLGDNYFHIFIKPL